MTLFETSAPVEALAAWRHDLPTPTKSRFMPLRAGVLNAWEYDDQQFWFTDGRLLLRGRNEAGKSKALELLFPFVLDGDMSPKKLDPFASISKTMWWNLVGFDKDNRKNPIAYLWLEFGRLSEEDTAEYLTAIVGMQASSAERKVTPWFALTPQRVDADLDLQPANLPLNQEAFTKALSAEARFTTKATTHRGNVATRLFSMNPERYDNLLHLLRQLRKPKLADKLDRHKLSEVLTNALPPLDETHIEPLAQGFGYLDDDISQLEHQQKALTAATSFLDVYRAYARTQVRQRADIVRAAITRFDDVTREETQNRRAFETARERQAALAEEAVDIARQLARASGNLEGLDLSAVETLNGLQQAAAEKDKTVEAIGRSADRARHSAETSRADATAKHDRRTGDAQTVTDALVAARRAASRAGVPAGWDSNAPAANAAELTGLLDQRRSLLNAVREANDRAGDARQKLAISEERANAAAGRLVEATEHLAAASDAADAAQLDISATLDRWASSSPERFVLSNGDAVLDELAGLLEQGDRAARSIAVRLTQHLVDDAAEQLRLADRNAARAREQVTAAGDALAAHDALPTDPPPPLRAGVPAARTAIALWQTIEFTDQVPDDQRAFLEAALDAAGLLDAVLSTDGLHDAVTDDTVLIPAPDGAGITDWLRPADDADHDLVDAVLRSIGAGSDSGRSCWVDLDGNWTNGPLTGRWSKATAEYIGAAARAAARARRHDELAAALTAAEAAHEHADGELAASRAAAAQVEEWRESFPTIVPWAKAEVAARAATSAADKADGEHRRALKHLEDTRAKVIDLLAAVDIAVTAAGARPDQVVSALEHVDAARDAARDLAAAARDLARSTEEAAQADARAVELEAQLAVVERELEDAQLAASEARAKYETALRVSGAEVAELLAEKERLESQISGLRDRKVTIDEQRSEAIATVTRAESVLAQTERERTAASDARDVALAEQAEVVRSGHVALAVPTDAGRDAQDFLQPTAGRTLARQIASVVGDDEATDAARSQALDRLVREYGQFRDTVPDFNPHLDPSGQVWVASATLNGELVGLIELHAALADDVAERQKAIAAEERNLIEAHLRDEVGNHLGDCLHAATTQVHQMNRILLEHPTSSGAVVQLHWQVDDDAGPSVKEAVRALLTSPQTRDERASAALATFLTERVALARSGDIDGADLAERLTAALDYRSWHTFRLTYRTPRGEGDLTARTVGTGSGGQQAKISHLPLLAAAAGFYATSPSAPRLCFLDEAFAGIDRPNTNDLLRMSVTLDLDMVMTNFDAWFCIPDLPGLAIYHLEKLGDAVGVAAIRYEWDGNSQTELDPWLDHS